MAIHSLRNLLHYFFAAMVVIPAVIIVLTGLDYVGRMLLHTSNAWMIPAFVVGVGSIFGYHYTRKE